MADAFISCHESSAGGLAAQIADTLESSGIAGRGAFPKRVRIERRT